VSALPPEAFRYAQQQATSATGTFDVATFQAALASWGLRSVPVEEEVPTSTERQNLQPLRDNR
jgi:hypothetical protein